VVSIDTSLLKGEAPRFSVEFNHPLLFERPFKFPRHLIGPLGIDNIIAVSAKNIHSAMQRKHMETKWKLTIHGNGHGHGNRHGHGIGDFFVPIAPYGMPLKYHGAISNGAIFL
jgi:hypothetical protein